MSALASMVAKSRSVIFKAAARALVVAPRPVRLVTNGCSTSQRKL